MIEQVLLDRLCIPLSEPYRLSTVTVEAFDVSIVRVRMADGSIGLGEVTSLEEYSAEDGDKVWENLQVVSETLPETDSKCAIAEIESALSEFPFSATGLVSAIETATGDGWPTVAVPVVGIVSAADSPDTLNKALKTQLAAGIDTIKLKIGFNPYDDAEALNRLFDQTPTDVSFRVDANQGYSLAEARYFIDHVSHDRLAHIEQPLPTGNLANHAALVAESPVDIILDEEVTTMPDIVAVEQAAAADGVKFKLMKCGGINRARRLISTAIDRGFTVILGNGVQSDIGCLIEAAVWEETDLQTVGEFNGWRKQTASVLESTPKFHDGRLIWDGIVPTLDDQMLNQFRTASARFGTN